MQFANYRNKYKLTRENTEQTYRIPLNLINTVIFLTGQIVRILVKAESRDCIINELIINGNPINDPEIMADKFNSHFVGLSI